MELEILENAKMLLGISTPEGADENESDKTDAVLTFLITDTIDAVMKYCRIEVLPRQLYGLIAQIVCELYRSRGYGDSESGAAVKSVTEGDRRVEFEGTSEVFSEFASRLEPYIDKSARLPSQLEASDDES